jgi:hypothetical protein
MSGFSGGPDGVGILQITGSGGIVITNPFGPITNVDGSGIVPAPVPCASYAVAGRVEIATLAESFDGTYLGATGCPLALSPVNQSVREEVASGAIFTPFSSPVTVLGFGAYSLDLQPNRTNVANLAFGAGSNCLGQDNRATGPNSSCLGQSNISTGARGVCFGSTNRAYADNTVAIGYRNEAGTAAGNLGETTAVGRSNFARARSSVAVGTMNNVAIPGNLNDATGVIGYDPQFAFAYSGVNSSALGVGNQVSAERGCGIGFKNFSSGGDDITCVGVSNYGARDFATAVGFTNRVYGARGSAFGYQNIVGTGLESVAVGRSNFSAYDTSVSVGIMNNALVPANLDDTTGVINADPQADGGNAINSSAFGIANGTLGLRSTCLGFKNVASGIGSTAVGDRAIARIDNTMNLAGPLIIRKDDGEPIGDAFRVFAGAEVIIMTDEVNLAAVADQTITLPGGCHFWWSECGIILTELTGVINSQPTIRMGITGTPAKYVGPVATTLLTGTLKRERYDNWQVDDGETSLVAGVTVGAVVGTSMAGRFFWRGVLIEDE